MKYVVKPKDAKSIELIGRRMVQMITPDTVDATQMTVVVDYVHPMAEVLPCHSHNAEEAVYIVSGKGEYWIDGNRGNFKTGEILWFPRNCKHMIRNTTEDILEIVCIFSPPMSPDRYTIYEDVHF
jgi:quercetin dioxygenase-like cupin family protein